MAAAHCFSFVSVNSSKPKVYHQGGSLSLHRRSSKILSMAYNQSKAHLTSSTEVSIPQTEVPWRPTPDYHPSVWDDYFISSSSSNSGPDARTSERIEELKKEVKNMLCSAATDPTQQLALIDKIQRLGVGYHFEADIENAFQHINDNAYVNCDLYNSALHFRLLRQAGHFVSPDVFNEFTDGKGEFLESLCNNLEGLLSLYEAAHLSIQGENLLDDAIIFCTRHLKALGNKINLDMTSEVTRSLALPLHKRVPRIEAPYYMSVYDHIEGSENDVLLQFAKLDYNALQLMHKAEIDQLSRWWKNLDICSKLPFQARDRLVESYALVMSIIPEPKYSTGRLYTTKLFVLLTPVDDYFDSYGTIRELEPFIDVIKRWDVNDIDQLPEFARDIIIEMYNIFEEIHADMAMRGLDFAVPYFIRETQKYIGGLLEEAKQIHSKTVPTLQEWWQISVTTIGVNFFIVNMVLATWDFATKESMEWSTGGVQINYSSALIGRLIDDINTFKSEQERGDIVSSVTCYMKEYGVGEDEAVANVQKMVNEEWKKMNKECLKPTQVPLRLLMIPVNTIRMGQTIFIYGDGFTNSKGKTREMIASLLINPLPV